MKWQSGYSSLNCSWVTLSEENKNRYGSEAFYEAVRCAAAKGTAAARKAKRRRFHARLHA